MSIVISRCGSENSNDSNDLNVSAPTTISGKSIRATVTSGPGGFASNGRSMFVVSNSDNTYKVLGDGINRINTKATFSYSADDNRATIDFDDSGLGKGNYNFTFTTKTKGTYTAESEQNTSAKQSGSFEVL